MKVEHAIRLFLWKHRACHVSYFNNVTKYFKSYTTLQAETITHSSFATLKMCSSCEFLLVLLLGN